MATPIHLVHCKDIFNYCVKAVLPQNLMRKALQYNLQSQTLILNDKRMELQNKNVYLVGAGKAVYYMAKEAEIILGAKIKTGIVSVPVGGIGTILSSSNVKYYEGAKNNLPDQNSLRTATEIKDLAVNLKENDILLVLLSGGGSALLPLPHESVTLDEKLGIIRKLGNAGADIKELNTVRKKLSGIKGGKLAIDAQPACVISLILSDIVGDPIDLIASGPTTENNDMSSKSIDLLKKYKVYDSLDDIVKAVINENHNYEYKEFPTNNVYNYIIGSNKLAIEAAVVKARENYYTIPISNTVTGNVITIAHEYFKLTSLICNYMSTTITLEKALDDLQNIEIPGLNGNWLTNKLLQANQEICLIFGGETTVEVIGNGKGGRNQQLALEFSKCLHNKDILKSFKISFLSAGTDGIDGPTDAAGAIGYKELISDATKEGLDVDEFLNNNDSYNFYRIFKNGSLHIITGHTNTNVMDMHLIIISRI